MGKDKKQSGVARSKFIDRIKSSTGLQAEHKENMNLNDIRQSAYKLPRSRSNPRYDHSLERKQPIRIDRDTLNSSTDPLALKDALRDYTSYAPTNNNTIKMDYCNASFSEDKDALSHRSRLDHSEELNFELREEEALDIIKSIWESTMRMKDKSLFKEEMTRIQGILKEVIVEMATPKLNSLHHSLLTHPAELRLTPFENSTTAKQSKKCSNNSIEQRPSKRQPTSSYANHESEDELEFKKIMYILEEKSKLTRVDCPSNCKEGRELKEISDILNVKTSCYSSFDCSSREPSGQTVRVFDKVSNSRSNERVFLKNIVKKAKTSVSNFEDTDRLAQDKRSRSDLSYLNHDEEHRPAISEEDEPEDSLLHAPQSPSLPSRSPSPPQSKVETRLELERRADPIKIETLQTVEDESESKRAVLNQIITMLNNKYHKNIKLEPRKF